MAKKNEAPEEQDAALNEHGETGVIEENEANLAFVFRGENKELDLTRALTKITHGMDRITLPAPELQAEPFYHKDAQVIANLFPYLYKVYKKK